MTERLYYTDSYQTTFTGTVTAVTTINEQLALQLDQSYFYPTSGGQPFDTGTLAGYAVVDVIADQDGHVHHCLAPLASDDEGRQEPIERAALVALVGTVVPGEITWTRRYDHMQQHSAQHLLSQVFYQEFGLETVSVHFGATESTFDLATDALDMVHLKTAEVAANELVYAALPIRAYFVTDSELYKIPLRKAPNVQGHIRIVEIDAFDYSACGGTHCRTTAEIGPIKCTKMERRRGQVRVTFLAGKRAYQDYALKHELLVEAANLFSNEIGQVPTLVERALTQVKELQRSVDELQRQLLHVEAGTLWDRAEEKGQMRVVQAIFTDKSVALVKELANLLTMQPKAIVLFAVIDGDKTTCCFGRAADQDVHMGTLLREVLNEYGGKGGGKPDFAQGGGVAPADIEELLNSARAKLP